MDYYSYTSGTSDSENSAKWDGVITELSSFASSRDCYAKRLFISPIEDFLQAFQLLQASVDYGFTYDQPGCFSTYLARQRTYASLGCLESDGSKVSVSQVRRVTGGESESC